MFRDQLDTNHESYDEDEMEWNEMKVAPSIYVHSRYISVKTNQSEFTYVFVADDADLDLC